MTLVPTMLKLIEQVLPRLVQAVDLVKPCCLQKSSKGSQRKVPPLFDVVTFNFPHVGLGIKDQASWFWCNLCHL